MESNHEDESGFPLLIFGLVNVISDEGRNREGLLLRVEDPLIIEKISSLNCD